MFASSGEITDPCPVPLSLTVTTPSSRIPALSHFWIRRMMRRSPTRCSTNRISHSWLTISKNDRMSASSIQFTFVLPMPTTRASSVSCWLREPAPAKAGGAEPIREPEEVFLVDRVQHHHDRTLDNLVLQRGNRQRTLSPIRLRYEPPPGWLRPIRSPMDPVVQVLDPAIEV